MTVAFSAAMEVNTLNWVKGNQMPTPPSSVKFGLLTAQPDHDGTNLNELNNINGYARQTVTFGAITTDSAGRISSMLNTNAVIFGPVTTADWAQVTYGAFFNGDDGSLIAYGPLAAARVAPVNDTISFGVGSLQLRSQ
jgi:hypothetical protein